MRKLGIAVVAAVAFITFVAGPAAAETTREYFQRMDEVYKDFMDKQPSEVNTSGTGFKPYMRYKSFVEPRLGGLDELPPGVRWEAYMQMKELEQDFGKAGETWFSLGPSNVAGRCLAIEVHPTDSQIVYAGFASGGLWKTTNFGSTWTPLTDDLPTLAVSAIEIDVNNPDRIWMGTGEGWGNVDAVHGVGVLVSTDAGATWNTTGYSYSMGSGRDVYELEHNPTTGTLMIAADNGLWRSTDGGTTFTAILAFGQWKDVELKKGSSSIMFACGHQFATQGFHRSTDDGLTWTLTTSGTPTTDMANMRFGLTDVDPEIIYWAISKGNGTMKGIWKSTNGGDSFTQVYTPGGNHYGSQGWYDLTISVDPQDANRVFSGGVNFYRSTNGGASFTSIASNVHVDHHATFWDPTNQDIFWIGSDGGVFRSTNSGNNYVGTNAGLITMQFYGGNHSITMPTRAVGGTQDNGTWVYNNSMSWGSVLGGDGFQCEIDWNNANTVYAELYFGEHFRSTTGGGGMVSINSGITDDGPWDTPTHMDYADPFILYTAHNSDIFKTTNRGASWTQISTDPLLGYGTSIHQSRSDTDVIVVTSTTKIWISTNGGTTWTDRTSGLISQGTFSDSHVHPTDPNTMVVTLSTYSSSISSVYKTTDQGVSWFATDNNLPNEPANAIEIDPSNPDWYFVGTDTAVYVSFNAGASWFLLNVGLPHAVIDDLRLHDPSRFLRVWTHGRGAWELDITDLEPVSAVGDPVAQIEPLTLRVLGNPVSEHATLRFGIREAGHVRLGVYDVSGRRVAQLVDRFAQPILDSVELDVSRLPSGVYFARLDAARTSISQKILVGR